MAELSGSVTCKRESLLTPENVSYGGSIARFPHV